MEPLKNKRAKLAQFELKNVKGLDANNIKGSGCYGEVLQVTVDGIPRIGKRLLNLLVAQDIKQEEREGIQGSFYDECLLISKLNHPNVVEFVGVHFDSMNPCNVTLIMEQLHTDLENFLKRPNIPLSVKLSILLDVSTGLLYFHAQLDEPLIHRDLSAANILISTDTRAKIADLGVSKLFDQHLSHTSKQTRCSGSLAYMPPEALQEEPVYGTELDIFSFGQVTLYTVLQEFPCAYDATNDPETPSAIQVGEMQILKRKKWINKVPHDHCLRSIILQCLQDKPDRRPGTKQLNTVLKTLCAKHPKSLADIHSSWGDQDEIMMYNTLANENTKFRETIVELSEMCANNLQMEQTMKELEDSNKRLMDRIEIADFQVKGYKLDFEEERRDREAAHSKLADLEKDMATLREWKKKFEKLEKENKASEATVKKLLADREDSTLQMKRLEEKLRLKTTECDHLTDQVQKLQSDMTELNQDFVGADRSYHIGRRRRRTDQLLNLRGGRKTSGKSPGREE